MTEAAGRIAVVTGSTSGIGRAVALALAGTGCRIVINGIDGPEAADQALADMRAAGAPDATFNGVDLLDPGGAARLISETVAQFGGIDILVNNAGIQHVAPIEDFPDETWNRIIDLNLSAPFRLIKAALPEMRRSGWGRIVNIASAHGLVASIHKSAYIAAKHGLVGLTKTVALETAAEPITCNAICPGFAQTAMVDAQIKARAEAEGIPKEEMVQDFLGEKQPSGAFIPPADIGALAVFLCSGNASQITGASFPIDGGWTAQ